VDQDGAIKRVDFYIDDVVIGSATEAPFRVDWGGGAEGAHLLIAIAVDNFGAITTSAPVNIMVVEPSDAPATELQASFLPSRRVELTWTDGAIDERRYQLEQSRDGLKFKHVATLRRNRTRFTRARLKPNTTYYFRVRAVNEHGATYSNIVAARHEP
jgi:predicted phage tail protein